MPNKEGDELENDTTANHPSKRMKIANNNIRDDDILEINAGGEFVINTYRSTLCLAEGTFFSNMFSGRWEDSLKRDKNGRIFLDHDPELIRVIVNFLRLKRIEDPSRPVASPKIPDDKKEAFRMLLHYFGLTEFFYGIPRLLDVSSLHVVQPWGTSVKLTRKENQIQFTYGGPDPNPSHYFAACTPSIDSSGEGSSWKVTIDALRTENWLYLGIIGNIASKKFSFTDSTSYGWARHATQVYHHGKLRDQDKHLDWLGFVEGECLYFHLQSNTLTMFSVQKNRKFVISGIVTNDDTKYYIHFNFQHSHNGPTKLTLEPLTRDELTRMQA